MGNTASLLIIDYGTDCYKHFGYITRYHLWHIGNYQCLPDTINDNWLGNETGEQPISCCNTKEGVDEIANALLAHDDIYFVSKGGLFQYDMVKNTYSYD